MTGEARLLCALGLVLLCVAANCQGAHCFAEGGGGHGGGGGFGGDHEAGGYSGDGSDGEVARQAAYGAGGGAVSGPGTDYPVGGLIHAHSAAGDTHGRVAASRASGTAALLAAAALVWWL